NAGEWAGKSSTALFASFEILVEGNCRLARLPCTGAPIRNPIPTFGDRLLGQDVGIKSSPNFELLFHLRQRFRVLEASLGWLGPEVELRRQGHELYRSRAIRLFAGTLGGGARRRRQQEQRT